MFGGAAFTRQPRSIRVPISRGVARGLTRGPEHARRALFGRLGVLSAVVLALLPSSARADDCNPPPDAGVTLSSPVGGEVYTAGEVVPISGL